MKRKPLPIPVPSPEGNVTYVKSKGKLVKYIDGKKVPNQ